jgi:hypothetical protein
MVGDIENPEVRGTIPEATEAQRKKFSKAAQIISAKYPDDQAKANEELNRYIHEHDGIAATIHNDIYGEDAFNIDLVVPELIHEGQLLDFFKTVLDQYSKFSSEAIERDYITKPKDWFESRSNRARLVLTEATNFNLKEMASAIVNASPLERVVPVGLDQDKQEAFKEVLIDEWQIKFEAKGDEYKNHVLAALSEITQKPYTSDLGNYDLKELMGPHTFTENKDISFDNMSNELGTTFHSKIDEIILHGNNNKLAEQLPGLSKDAEAQQYLALKASAFATRGNSPFWTAHLEAEHEPLKVLVASKNPESILSPGKFSLNPDIERIFQEKATKHGLKEKDVNFLKGLFLDKSLYMNNLSPQLYATTITKAQSGINGKGAVVVGNALPWAIIGRIIATAYGARFSVNSTMIDTANDIHQEQQEHRLGYKNMFTQLAVHGQKNNQESSFENAIDNLFATYAMVERSDEIINQTNKAEIERFYSLQHANEANQKNELGIKLLTPQPANFAYGVIATGIGLAATFASGFNPSTVFPVFGASVFAGSTGLLAASLISQRNANLDLSQWHRASARARQSSKNVQDIRDHKIKERTAELTNGASPRRDYDLSRSQSFEETKSQEEEIRPLIEPVSEIDRSRQDNILQSPGNTVEPLASSVAASSTADRLSLEELSRVPDTAASSKQGAGRKSSPRTKKKSPSLS